MADLSEQSLNIKAIPAFNDNYIWCIDNQSKAIVFDPGDASVVINELQSRSLTLCAILLTHRHEDHIGGVPALVEKYQVPVYGPENDKIESVTRPIKEGTLASIKELGLSFVVLDIPGHTKGHVAYYSRMRRWLFCGDMLFGAGCGRMFEGDAKTMFLSLSKLASLPDETQVFCGHEYTVSNLKFALEIEPTNKDTLNRLQAETEKRSQGLPTLPSSIALEKKTNPFLRAEEPHIQKTLHDLGLMKNLSPIDAFGAMRDWKDIYR